MADTHDHGKAHVHGTMDTKVQEKTFAGFISMTMWGVGISIGVLIFMALVNA
ncbi:MAG TPA: aa3-type cytochrome c oxidase subunit IV [Paracoccaceae bacterium]|nr:aa3-type cytochrome c oxidase subunit IV [Paracoccaceae bacterium]HMO72813.1 aa3-type cytochrome c oxidase subunit IV [Paracoccaceae bacterium]